MRATPSFWRRFVLLTGPKRLPANTSAITHELLLVFSLYFVVFSVVLFRMIDSTLRRYFMKNLYLIAVVLILTLSGCASAPEPRPKEDTAFYLARFDNVWDAALMALEEEAIPIETMEKEKGLITTGFVNFSVGPQAHHEIEKIAQKPETRLAIWSQVGYTLSILITPINDMSTKARIKAHIEAYDKNVTRQWHECTTNGFIEDMILEKIRAQL